MYFGAIQLSLAFKIIHCNLATRVLGMLQETNNQTLSGMSQTPVSVGELSLHRGSDNQAQDVSRVGSGNYSASGTALRKLLAVASGGGHWVQLQRLRPVLQAHDVAFVTTHRGYEDEVAPFRLHVVNDASRTSKFALIILALRMFAILLRERPDVVISTGAAPGYFALRLGRLLGARTIWLDSIANVDEMSMAGRLARPYADLWLTQWPHLASPDGPQFAGAVL